jgi:hypothetical protein
MGRVFLMRGCGNASGKKATMNWKLIVQLSLFGLAMGVATVFVIPSNIEPFCWLAIFVISAYVIATRSPRLYFLHGLLVSMANSVWITSTHVLLFGSYVARHPQEVEMMKSMPLADSPRLLMGLTGPVIGIVSGIVLGLFAVIAHSLVGRRGAPA